MAVDIIMKIGEIKGESSTHGEKEWLAATGFSHGVTQDITTEDMKEDRKLGGKPHFSFLTVRRKVDIASPDILVHCITSAFIKNVEVRAYPSTTSGDKPIATYRLENCYIASVNSDGANDMSEPMESVSIAYNKVELEVQHKKATTTMKKKYDLVLGSVV